MFCFLGVFFECFIFVVYVGVRCKYDVVKGGFKVVDGGVFLL